MTALMSYSNETLKEQQSAQNGKCFDFSMQRTCLES